jgi:hypothetical protein
VTPYAYAAFPVYDQFVNGSLVCWAKFSAEQMHVQVVQQSVGGPIDSLPCVACVPKDLAFIAWQHLDSLRVVSAYCPPSWWNDVLFTALPAIGGDEARHPFIEAFGDVAYLVWQNGKTSTIMRSNRNVWSALSPWKTPEQVSATGFDADFPVHAKSDVTAWQQSESGGATEVVADIRGLAINLSSTPDSNSFYPSVDAVVTTETEGPGVSEVYGLWSEEVWPDSLFQARLHGESLGSGDSPSRLEPSHTVICGQAQPSVYCRRRTGRRSHRGFGLDISTDSLSYALDYFDPRYNYCAAVVLLHDRSQCVAAIRSGDIELAQVTFGTQRAETVEMDIPREAYESDSALRLTISRLSGQYVATAGVRFYAAEDFSPEHGGTQATATNLPASTRLLTLGSNPIRGVCRVAFELAVPGSVQLTVHDAAGRAVRTLVTGEQPAGRHCAIWNGRDDSGRLLAPGVYFVRLEAGVTREQAKVVLAR